MTIFLQFFIILLMLAATAVFVTYEMALVSISKSRLLSLSQQKGRGADAAVYMKERIESSLAVTQIGITLAGAIAAAIGGAGVVESLAPVLMDFGFSETVAEILSLVCLVLPLSSLMIIFSELAPKIFALANPEWVCLTFSPLMKVFSQIGYPILDVFERIAKLAIGFGSRKFPIDKDVYTKRSFYDLKSAIALARASHLIGAGEEKIVLSAAELSSRPISSIVLPAQDISMFSMKSTLSEALIKAHLDMHTRFPVCEEDGDPQTISGYVNFKDIVAALKINPEDPSVKGIMMPIKNFSATVSISQVLERMIQDKIHIALVKSEDGKIFGMITLEDILEELVGEIEDEYDKLPTHIHPYGTTWIMGGGVPMNTVTATLKIDLPFPAGELRVPTLSEWFGKKFNRPLHGGDTIESNRIIVTVRKLRRKKLYEAIVSIVP